MEKRNKLKTLDIDELWEYELPNPPANDEDILRAESILKCKLDEAHASFLKNANGWNTVKQSIDILSTNQLIDSEEMEKANMLLTTWEEEGVLASSGFNYDELLPIAVSSYDIDLIVISKSNSHNPGIVI